VPDRRKHRGKHPEDARLFGPEAQGALRAAVADLSLLLTRGYAEKSALKLVGDRFALDERQRRAVMRATCSDESRERRRAHQAAPEELRGRPLVIDGYNVLTTVEAALAAGVILAARDGTCRDIAGLHGTYRKVEETLPALALLGRALDDLGVAECRWYLDSPVSNSGRLKTVMLEVAARSGWPWKVEVVPSPDRVLIESGEIVATSDSAILDRCGRWFNLARAVVAARVPQAFVVELSSPPEGDVHGS